MENLAPSLVLLWDVKRSIEKGQSASQGVKSFLARPQENVFQYQIETWWRAKVNSKIKFNIHDMPFLRRQLLSLIELGLNGESILNDLKSLELEMILNCEEEIEKHVALMPVKMMFPLLGFVFPAMLILLICPLLKMLQF